MSCFYCDKDGVYVCSICGRSLCEEHLTLRVTCSSHFRKSNSVFTIRKAVNEEEKSYVRSLVRRFWGEEQQLTFDRKFDVAELPVFIAKVKSKIAGFISFSSTGDTLVIVALGIIPMYQNRGIGSGLIQKVETEARRLKTKRILVSTSNDDLPALGFYQSHGFQVYDVKPNAIAEKHGKVSRGLGGLPVRDELRLQKMLD